MTKPLYFYNGTTFELVGPTTPQSPIAYQTSAPTAPATGDLWIDSDGDVDTYNRQLTRYYFVATAGQTSVSGVDANGLTLAYVAGSEAVYVNGALQVRGVDYTATNGTSITGLSALGLNDVVEVFAYTAFTVANAYTKSETDSVAAAAAGLRMVVPSSVAVGSGSGSIATQGTVSFSGASSVSLNGCFSSTYTNYLLNLNLTSASTTVAVNLRFRTSGTDNSNSSYYYAVARNLSASSSLTSYDRGTPASYILLGECNALEFSTSLNVFNPQATNRTQTTNLSQNNITSYWSGGSFDATTSFDGFTIYPSSGTITGTLRVYGYKD